MHRLHFAIVINAPKEKVWETMLGVETYRTWTEPFMPGSHYVGDWDAGSRILFLAPDETGELSGMVSRIKENRRYEYVSIEHLGVVREGKEDTTSEEVRNWAGALENYLFKDLGGRTELTVEMDTTTEYRDMFESTWPKALQRLKELAEE
jgi:uncharacterized protein YndB with AHSA1/START domain